MPNPDPALITEWKPCQPGAGVTEVVDFGVLGSGKVDVSCAPTIAAQTSGFKALTDAGFTHTTRKATPGFLETITGCPGTTCPAHGTVGSGGTKGAYWSYWLAKAPGDVWAYSGVGGATPRSNGTTAPFQAWSYGGTPPRVPVMDSRGPVTVTPDAEPSSAGAVSLGESWIDPIMSALAAQCAAQPATTTPTSSYGCVGNYSGLLLQYVDALTAAGVPYDQLDPGVLTQLRASETSIVEQGDAGRFQLDTTGPITLGTGRSAADLLSALVALRAAGDATPADVTEITSLVTEMEHAATLTTNGHFPYFLTKTKLGRSEKAETFTTPQSQGQVVAALLSAGATVPVAPVDALVSYVAPAFTATIAVATKGTSTDIQTLAYQILGLAAVLEAPPSQVVGGTWTATAARSVVTADADALVTAQRADGGYNAPAQPAPKEVWTTALATQALAAAGTALGTPTVTAAARAASRWLASMQLTPAAVGIRAGSADLGVVAPTSGNFVAYATNGIGYDPATANYFTATNNDGASALEQRDLPDTITAMRDWSLAPYADATIATPSATATSSGATVSASVAAGTDAQTVSLDYGTTSTLTTQESMGSVVVPATTTQTVTFTPAGLSPDTTYYYRVVATSPVKPGSADTVTVRSTIASFTTPFAVTLGTTADLTTAVRYLTSPANLADGTHYDPFGPTYPTVGLTIDGALGLAATRTANPTLAMIATWVAANATSYTGLGTSYVSGGALGKVALLAEVVGQDPRDFGGQDLVSALDQAVCTTVSASCVAAGNYTTSSSVFDQALGILAQLRAGDTAGVAGPIAYLESLQKGNGAWSGLIPASSTTTVDSTAMAVMALALTPSTTAQLAVQVGLDWMVTQQQGDGGFTGASGISVNSTALAIMAMGLSTFYGTQIAAGEAFLAAEQNPDGGFTTAVGTATGSNLRASTQAVNGVVGTSFGTLSDPLTAPTPPPPPPGSTTANGASSSTPAGTATAALPPATAGAPSPVTASGTGQGALTVARYPANPTATTVSGGTGIYYDVQVSSTATFSSVTVTVCTLGPGGQSLTWWNGTGWAPFSDQTYDASTGCVTATVSATTSPTEAQLTGTPVAPSSDPIAQPTLTPTPTPAPSPTPSPSPTGATAGYWEVALDGGIFAFGDAGFYGSMGGQPLNAPVVGLAVTPDGKGYWEVASDGGVFAFGSAQFYGSMGGKPLNQPIVGIAATPDGKGYWEVASDGGLFAFGDAGFYGSMGGTTLNKPVVGIAATPDGKGYWEVASDGGLFAFGDAAFYGSMGGTTLNKPVVGIAATPDTGSSSASAGGGYWEVASDGGVFAFGDAAFYGSMGGKPLNEPIVGAAAAPTPPS